MSFRKSYFCNLSVTEDFLDCNGAVGGHTDGAEVGGTEDAGLLQHDVGDGQ